MNSECQRRVIETATKIFSEYGIKKVCVEDIADIAKVSKRTIYATFKSKNALVEECIKHIYDNIDHVFDQTKKNYSNVFLSMYKFSNEIIKLLKDINIKFWEELKPVDLLQSDSIDKWTELRIKWEMQIQKAQREGYIIENLPTDFLSTNLIEIIQFINEKKKNDLPQYQVFDILDCVNKVYFRGIATDKGREILKRELI